MAQEINPFESPIFVDPSRNLSCPISEYSEYTIHASFFSQASMIIVYGGVIFNIAIYGVKSTFSSTTTFLLDDISIFAISFAPIISWYFMAKPLTLLGIDDLTILVSTAILTFILLLVITYLLFLYNWPCHKDSPWLKRNFAFTNNGLSWIKFLVVHTYLIHSILIIFYDCFTSPESYKRYHTVAFINFQLLNFFTDILYLSLTSYLIFKFYRKNHIVHKKLFFITVFLSTTQFLFEYALICSAHIIDTIFTFVLTTILTRSVASFFSQRRETANIYGINATLIYEEDEEIVKYSNKYNGIKLIFEYGNNSKKTSKTLDLYGAKVFLIDTPADITSEGIITGEITTDEKAPTRITLVYENDEGITTEKQELKRINITGKTVKFNITEGFGFLNYIIYHGRPPIHTNDPDTDVIDVPGSSVV